MRKYLFTLTLLLLARLGLALGQTPNYDFSAVSPSGDTLYYTITSPTTVSVTPPNFDYDSYEYDWSGYTKPTDTLIIPASVSNGGTSYSVTTIGGNAFYYCTSLASVTIPNSITSIGDATFSNCTSLASVAIPNSVASIGSFAFYNCTSLASVTIPNSVTSIELYTFSGCTSLASVTIPSSVTSIGGSAFYNCRSLASVTIPNSVTSIGGDAFHFCTSLASVTIPNSVTTIGGNAFYYCTSLASVTIPNSVTSIGYYAFYNCTSLASVTIPSSVTSIEYHTFDLCTSLASVTIPSSVTSIGGYAFYNCTSLSSVVIPSSITSIGQSAFYSCTSLASVTIPDSVTSIGGSAFYNVRHIEYHGEATGAPWGARSMNGFTDEDFIYTDSTRASLLSYIGNSSNVLIPNTVTSIEYDAFRGCTSLTSVTIPSSVTSISGTAFSGCTSLTTVFYNAVNATIEGYYYNHPFQGTSITSFIFGDSVINIPNYLCSGLSGLTSVIISNSVTSIGQSAFSGCRSLASVTIPSSVTSIGSSAFSYCTSLSTVYYNAATATYSDIYVSPFSNDTNITSFFFGDSVRSIPNRLCQGLSGLLSVAIPNSVTSIGQYAFSGCTSLASVTIPNSVTSIGNSAFINCISLSSVYYNAGNISSSINIFYNDTNITTFVFGSNVSSIPQHLCSWLTGLTSVTISSSVTSIGLQAFYGCSGLRNITLLRTTPPSLQYNYYSSEHYNSFSGVPSDVQVWVPCNAVGNYVSANGWRDFNNISEMTDCDGHYWDFYKSMGSGNVVYYKILDDSASVAVVHPLDADTIAGTFWHGYSRPSGNLFLPSTVEHDSVAYVVRMIGSQAFKGCTGLANVSIPATIDTIGNSAFANCYGLRSVWFNADSCRYMGEADSLVFQNDRSLYSLHIGSNVRNIPDYAFERCTGLTAIHIPDSVVNIGAWSFAYDANVTDLTIGEGVEYIGEYAFYGCGRLQRVVVPPHFNPSGTTGGGSGWGSGVFGGCGFNSFSYGGGSIPDNMFAGNMELDTVYISDTITSIGDSAFLGCTSLTSISGLPELWIPRRVDSVGNAAYGNCIAATRVRYEADSCLRMGSDTLPVFMNDSSIATLVIGEYVRWIPDYAFLGCTGLESITTNSMEAPVLGVDVFRDVVDSIPVYIPCGSLASYTARWSHFTNFVEMPFEDTIIVQTADAAMGTATVLTQPSCANARTAEIAATANHGYHFVAWSDGDTTNPRTVVVVCDTVLTALFDRNEYMLTLLCDETQGTVTGAGTYLYGDTASVTVMANEGFVFNSWAETGSAEQTFDTVIDGDVVLTALFDTMYFTLTLESSNSDWGSVTGGGEYAYGSEVEITAVANEGYHFVQWSDGVTENPRVVVLLEDMELTAVFAEGVGVETVESAAVRLYPNPTTGVLNIEAEEVQRVEVYDLGGRVVIRSEQPTSIDFSAVPSGVYYVKVVCQQGTTVHKVVKK